MALNLHNITLMLFIKDSKKGGFKTEKFAIRAFAKF